MKDATLYFNSGLKLQLVGLDDIGQGLLETYFHKRTRNQVAFGNLSAFIDWSAVVAVGYSNHIEIRKAA